jgi:hypothetical protein
MFARQALNENNYLELLVFLTAKKKQKYYIKKMLKTKQKQCKSVNTLGDLIFIKKTTLKKTDTSK